MKFFGLALSVLLLACFQIGWCQNEYYRSSELNFSKASLDGIVNGDNLVVNLGADGVQTICLFRENFLIQKRGVSASELLLRGLLEKDNLIYVFFSFKNSGKWQEGVLTFYKNNRKPPAFESIDIEGKMLVSYNYDEGFQMVVFNKKKSAIELHTFFMNKPASIKNIVIEDKELEKLISKNEFTFIYSNTYDFNLLASKNKAFLNDGKLVLLIDEDEIPAVTPKLKKVVADFSAGNLFYNEIKLPLAPKSEHTSYLHNKEIFTWGLNNDYFSLSIYSLDSLKTLTSFVYLKSISKIDLKATPVFYATGAPLNDRDWEWKDPSIKKVDEEKPSDILKQFIKGSMVFKVTQENNQLKLLFGTYQGVISPSRNLMPTTIPGVVIPTSSGNITTSPTQGFTTMTNQGIVERRKYFYGFINPTDWTILNDYSFAGSLIEDKIDNRIKDILEDDKIGGITSIIHQEKGYLIYLLRKDKEFVIEEIK